jgi:hypothetical protein
MPSRVVLVITMPMLIEFEVAPAPTMRIADLLLSWPKLPRGVSPSITITMKPMERICALSCSRIGDDVAVRLNPRQTAHGNRPGHPSLTTERRHAQRKCAEVPVVESCQAAQHRTVALALGRFLRNRVAATLQSLPISNHHVNGQRNRLLCYLARRQRTSPKGVSIIC